MIAHVARLKGLEALVHHDGPLGGEPRRRANSCTPFLECGDYQHCRLIPRDVQRPLKARYRHRHGHTKTRQKRRARSGGAALAQQRPTFSKKEKHEQIAMKNNSARVSPRAVGVPVRVVVPCVATSV